MSKKTRIIILIIIILLLAGVIFFLYYKYNPRIEDEITTKSIYLKAFSVENESELIEVNFLTLINGSVYGTGKTNKVGLEEIKIPLNKDACFISYDEERRYYSTYFCLFGINGHFDLYKIGDIFVNESEKGLKQGKHNKTLIITTNHQLRELWFCISWSYGILNIKNYDYILINPPQRLENKVEKCWHARKTINEGENLTIILEYETFDILKDWDEISIYIGDSDRSYLNEYIIENEEGKDIGKEDIKYIIKK